MLVKSQKGKAMMLVMKCPVLWKDCVKYVVKSLRVKNIKNKKGLKNTEHLCLLSSKLGEESVLLELTTGLL